MIIASSETMESVLQVIMLSEVFFYVALFAFILDISLLKKNTSKSMIKSEEEISLGSKVDQVCLYTTSRSHRSGTVYAFIINQ